MSPEEKTVIAGIFDRLAQAEGQPRDAEAERFIAERIQAQPYAPYVMAQAIYVQEQALTNLNQEVEQLRAEVEELSRRPQAAPQGSSGFLSGLFGGGAPQPQPQPQYQSYQSQPNRPAAPMQPETGGPSSGPWGRAQPAPAAGPWGQQAAPGQRGGGLGGGGFLAGAMSTALGVAGGMMIANALSSAFSGGDEASKLAGGLGLGESGKESGNSSPAAAGSDAPAADKGWQDASADEDDIGFDDGGFDDGDFA
ncbi:DUF2076 domain-containing protein [Blastochloris sulfoviridis]|uniref:DUF2076 domain-containing protein n=1 Tax=Blastochloris sulfoviridis TaxID=50712 RepID=A0A5M6HSR3_9HYPH|nr:DUF2076 domain-containing protein [Blastochloris sulfoviridis]KAA5598954.1 DUF2076 domain-containing protein [Blastochloris sulfoviridis]